MGDLDLPVSMRRLEAVLRSLAVTEVHIEALKNLIQKDDPAAADRAQEESVCCGTGVPTQQRLGVTATTPSSSSLCRGRAGGDLPLGPVCQQDAASAAGGRQLQAVEIEEEVQWRRPGLPDTAAEHETEAEISAVG